ncbi:hypothetical protein [Actinoplanes sp. NPDC089786]|uniref:hypothetical protein n=1 Tax=Actinoplanes sp. NPDC089786 TaxID=3155185 RepID=UPI0034476718
MNRTRRSWLIASVVMAAAVVVSGGVATSSAAVTTPAPAATAKQAPAPHRLGELISTGLDATKISEWVIYGAPITGAGITFGFTVAERQNDGSTEDYVTVNEYRGSALAPGFHPAHTAMRYDGDVVQPAFGYYVGRPAKVTGRFGGRTVAAHTAGWSHDRSVTVFWFDPADRTEGPMSALTAVDAAGRKLTAGHPEVFES